MTSIEKFTQSLREDIEMLVPELPDKKDLRPSFIAGFLSCRRMMLSNIKRFFTKTK